MAKRIKYYKNNLIEYDLLKFVDYYDPILRVPTTPYDFSQPDAHKHAVYLMFSLIETMNEAGGLGLSANQVGLSEKVCAVNMGDEVWIMFNPEVIEESEVPTQFFEGCLSYPGLYLKVDRPDHVKVRFQAVNGEVFEKEFDGLTAVCVQHEIDHLNGIVYTDKVSPIKLEKAKRKVKTNLKKMRKISKQHVSAQPDDQPVQPDIKINLDVDAPTQPQPDKFVYRLEL